ncbi:MAG: hypothetical protein AAF799_45035 [Myxococcota bacterium]
MNWKRLGRVTATIAEWLGVVFFGLILLVLAGVGITLAWVGDDPEPMGYAGKTAGADEPSVATPGVELPPASPVEASSSFKPIYEVLVSPRCMNCHPEGDRPLGAVGGVHAMNISRASMESGLACSTCHAEHNTELPGGPPGPPGAPHWQLPPKETPMVFENRTITALCKQLRDPGQNGERSLADLLHHVEHDPLVLWGWNPGGDRTPPPISHESFVKSFAAWVEAGGICPGETEAPNLGTEPEPTAGDESEAAEPA